MENKVEILRRELSQNCDPEDVLLDSLLANANQVVMLRNYY